MEKTKGLIIRQSDYGDGNRMLTVFTEDFGIIKAAVYGVKKAKSRQSAASQLLSWGEFILYFGKGEVASVNSVTSLESFFPVYEDLEKLALCSYLCDVTYHVQGPSIPNNTLLRLMLNSFYACAYLDVPIRKIKTVYELRLAADMGYMPVLSECAKCGEKKELCFFSPANNGFICGECHIKGSEDIFVSEKAYRTVGYILLSDEKKIFSFETDDETLAQIGTLSELYLLRHTEKNFSSLEYLKKVLTY